jgi:hypothetical protein
MKMVEVTIRFAVNDEDEDKIPEIVGSAVLEVDEAEVFGEETDLTTTHVPTFDVSSKFEVKPW